MTPAQPLTAAELDALLTSEGFPTTDNPDHPATSLRLVKPPLTPAVIVQTTGANPVRRESMLTRAAVTLTRAGYAATPVYDPAGGPSYIHVDRRAPAVDTPTTIECVIADAARIAHLTGLTAEQAYDLAVEALDAARAVAIPRITSAVDELHARTAKSA